MKNFLPRSVIIIFLIFICYNVAAQSSISGRVIDEKTNEAMSFGNITLLNTSDSVFIKATTSDEKGNFAIEKVDTGIFLLRFSYIGYSSIYLPVSVNEGSNKTDVGTIKMSQGAEVLGEALVAARKPMYNYENEKKIYNVTEDPAVQNGVATDALQNAPGVYVDMEGNITLRGVSSVSIWINDKPSRITGEGLKTFLQQLPANSLERIEVITNPSAKYSAEGTGGIINIVTKEKIRRNFLLSGGISGGTQPSYNPWVSFIWSKDKWSLNAYVAHNNNKWKSDYLSDNTALSNGDTLYSSVSSSIYENINKWNYASVYGSYDFDTTNTIEFWFGGGLNSFTGTSNAEFSKITPSPYEYFVRTEIWKSDNMNDPNTSYNYGLTYSHNFKKEGHILYINAYSSSWGNGKNTSESERSYNTMPWKNRRTLSYEEYGGTWNSGEIQYENPVGKNRMIEAGCDFTYNTNYSESVRDTFDYTTQQWLYVPLFYDHYKQDVTSFNTYVSYSDTLWMFTYKLGLRSEVRDFRLKSWSTNKIIYHKDRNLFPTAHLSWSTKSQYNITMSYARRISYPDYQMSPFVSYFDEESVYTGNPLLKPSFTDSYEAGFAKFFGSGSSVNLTIYHRRTKNEINRYKNLVFDSLLNRNTMFTTYLNSGSNIFTGTELTFNYSISQAYRIMLNFDAYRYDIDADLGAYSVDRTDINYSGKLILTANLGIFRFNATTIYRSAAINISGEQEAVCFINLSGSADLFNRSLSLRVGVQDIFDWQKDSGTINTPTLISEYSNKRLTRYATFGITYRFGKTELESKAKNVQAPMGGQN